MKTLQEIKDEYAKEVFGYDWYGWTDSGKDISEEDVNEVSKRFSIEVAKETIKNISSKSEEMHYYVNESCKDILGNLILRKIRTCYAVPKQTILSESNIPSL